MLGEYGFSYFPSNSITPIFESSSHERFQTPLTPQTSSPKSAFEDLSKLNEFKKVVENVYAIQSLPVEEDIKREEIDNYLERKVKEFEGTLETYGIKAYDTREKYFALSYLGAVVEDDLSLGCYSKERIGKEVNEVLEMERASEELVRRGLYEYKNGELVRTPDYRKKRKQYPRKEIRKLERKAGVKNRRWFAVAASLTMLGAVGLAGCVTDKVPQIFKPQNPKDGDVLPDEWEMKYFGNLEQTPDGDPDHDYVDNYFEWKYGTDPTTPYTYKGLDDFNLLYTYPHYFTNVSADRNLTQKEINEFLQKIPNVEPRYWTNTDGSYRGIYKDGKYINISIRDPLVQYYAKKVHIEWRDDPEYGRVGKLKLGDEPLFLEYGRYDNKKPMVPPVFYLTHGRKSTCLGAAVAHMTLLLLNGYNCTLCAADVTPDNGVNKADHGFLETEIDGKIYIVNFNDVVPRADKNGISTYEKWRWELENETYDPNWAKNHNYRYM